MHDDNAYSKTLALLGAHDPAVLILPNDARSSVLQRIVRSDFPLASIEHLQRKHWDAARGLVMLSHYALPAHAQDLKASLENQQLALAALAALLHYIEFHDKVALYRGALKLSVAVVQGIMPLEPATVRNLELLRSARTGEASRSLFAVLNSCSTAAGARLLRSSITQPSTDARTINMRLDCVGTLLREGGLLVDLRKLLPAFSDCNRILQHFVRHSSTASSDRSGRTLESTDSVLHLKAVLQMAPQLAAALSRDGAQPPEDELLLQMHECLASPELEALERTIGQVIEEDAGHAKRASQKVLQSLFAVRPAIDARLDVARVTLGDLVGAMELLLERAHSHQNATYLSLDYNMKRGYHFTLPAARRAEAEALGVFIQMQMQGKKKVSCTTDELARLNSRCKEAIDEILARSVSVLEQLVTHVQTRLHLLFQIAESVAQLDMYVSFATYAQRSACECTIPTLVAPGEPLVLKRAYHPVLESLGDFSAVANDAFVSPSCNLQVITGPNMSGKSTYLKQVALICLMAHMGCPVPAQVASVPRMQRILTCLSAVDGIDSDSSTFQCEMREMSHILRSISASDDQHVLVLVDELGRGTSSRDGAAIAWAVAEELQRRPRTYALFATHFLQLANLHELYPNVKQLRLIVEPAESRLNFLFKLEAGVTTQQQYMTDYLAAVAGIPSEVCDAARNLCQRFQFDPAERETAHARIEAARLALAERLVWLGRNSTMSDRNMRAFLIEFKSQLSLDSLKRPHSPERPIKRGRGSCDGTARSSAPSASTPAAGASAIVDKDTHAAHALLSLGSTDTPQPDARRHFATTPPQKLALPPLGPTTPEPTIDGEAQWRELDALADAAVWPRATPTCDEHLTLDELLAQAA